MSEETKNRWVSVEGSMPIPGVSVLTVTDAGNIAIRRRYAKKFAARKHGSGTVTHWMPLPELPDGILLDDE